MPYYTKRSLDEWFFPQSQRHRRRQALPLPRAHPLLLQSTPCSTGYFAKCSVLTSFPILVLAHASFFAPRSYPSIWLTNISPTSCDELRSHPRTAPDADPDHDCRVSSSAQWRPPGSATPAFRRRQSQCGDYNRHSLALGGAHH